jgi:phospholipase/carboxylesterase
MIRLAESLSLDDFSIIVPQAPDNAWYPYTFLAPQAKNEPWLSSSLQFITELINDIAGKGIDAEKLFFLGFSQGACLALEYAARNAAKYGGIISLTGGLIGDNINYDNYKGDFENTPVFMSSSSNDPHVPLERVMKTAELYREMNAGLTLKVYNGSTHRITFEEIEYVNQHFLS